jgi:hypothetical protein
MTRARTTDDPRVTCLEGTDGGFRVRSHTRPGLEHTVQVPEGTCNCEAGRHGVDCWHLDFCRAVYYWHRYERRAQLWARRAARLAATKAERTEGGQPAGTVAGTVAVPERCSPRAEGGQ